MSILFEDNIKRLFDKSSIAWERLHDDTLLLADKFKMAEGLIADWIGVRYADVRLSFEVCPFLTNNPAGKVTLAFKIASPIALDVVSVGLRCIPVLGTFSFEGTVFFTDLDWDIFCEGLFLDSLEEDVFASFDEYLLELLEQWRIKNQYSKEQVPAYLALENRVQDCKQRKESLISQICEDLPDYAIDLTEFLDII